MWCFSSPPPRRSRPPAVCRPSWSYDGAAGFPSFALFIFSYKAAVNLHSCNHFPVLKRPSFSKYEHQPGECPAHFQPSLCCGLCLCKISYLSLPAPIFLSFYLSLPFFHWDVFLELREHSIETNEVYSYFKLQNIHDCQIIWQIWKGNQTSLTERGLIFKVSLWLHMAFICVFMTHFLLWEYRKRQRSSPHLSDRKTLNICSLLLLNETFKILHRSNLNIICLLHLCVCTSHVFET